MSAARLPLSRFRVLDLTAHRAGPTCARQLADWGADVIKIEPPAALDDEPGGGLIGRRHGSDFQNLHRNKRSLTLNLKDPKGKAIFFKLVEGADVVLENYRSDVKTRLGVDYESCRKVNPRIVYGSIAGFGQSGPYATRPGVDQIAQGMGGLMSITGLPGQGPVRVGIPIADLTSGHFLAQGVLIALLDREHTGEGQWVHTSLLEAQIAMLDFQGSRWLIDHEVPGQAGNDHPTSTPTGVFPTSDGTVNIAAAGDRLYRRLCEALGRPDLVTHPDFSDTGKRSRNRAALNATIAEVTRGMSSKDLVDLLTKAGVPCGPIYSIDQTFNDPQVQHLGIARKVEHGRLGTLGVVGQPINMSAAPQPETLRMPTPELGEHSDAVLAELGYDAEAIADLRKTNVI
ncbi:CaiB/BaiF CoA-transferase family protein [Roseomonas sp. AR75]|uniref:CaiB/BaiF CoA transferase family protein n=1 Tax=Roseomonas sp. AR75 TaxID=2562311 RepID=UPI0010BFF7AB|nr:CaiB/BaiF CoA-transferase family protein [Roseomonas sp. AR75]